MSNASVFLVVCWKEKVEDCKKKTKQNNLKKKLPVDSTYSRNRKLKRIYKQSQN